MAKSKLTIDGEIAVELPSAAVSVVAPRTPSPTIRLLLFVNVNLVSSTIAVSLPPKENVNVFTLISLAICPDTLARVVISMGSSPEKIFLMVSYLLLMDPSTKVVRIVAVPMEGLLSSS